MTRGYAHLVPLLPVALLLALPFVLRPRDEGRGQADETLIVVTPHNEAIRSEIGNAFQAYMRRAQRRRVSIDWRSPGGASEIARYLSAQYTASFRVEWSERLHHPWSARVASAFANPATGVPSAGAASEEQLARAAFLASDVSAGADVLLGGGSSDFITHAAAGRLVDAGLIAAHPELFNDAVIPKSLGGEPYWDERGRWIGTCLSGFGICYNLDSVLRVGLGAAPAAWDDLADPHYAGQIALADPNKSGSALKTFEMLIQQQIQARVARSLSGPDEQRDPQAERAAVREGWAAAMRLIRRVAANARYFTDSASKVPMDIAAGDAAAGMCIDFYGRFQAETIDHRARSRLAFVAPRGGTSIGADPVALLRGAPHGSLARDFIAYLLSEDGQKLWDYRVGTPGGPVRYALRRLPILPVLYDAEHQPYASDPDARPYEDARAFHYRAEWTAPLLRAVAFVIRVMCVEPHEELARAYRALVAKGNPAEAMARFDDVGTVDYELVAGRIRSTLAAGNPVLEITLANEMIRAFRAQYDEATALAEGTP